MTNLPKFITFTGADDKTSIDGMLALAALYPIEWGILFSPKQQGRGRYPSIEWVKKLVTKAGGLKLSAHLCGGHARDVMALRPSAIDPLILVFFARAQINTAAPVSPRAIREWADGIHVTAIVQSRDPVAFPANEDVAWLYDCSGGRGVLPASWPFEALPPAPGVPPRLVGFAGGLGPDNVAEAVKTIGADTLNYWIDMESRVRNGNDEFDLELCRQVCEAVYGKRG